MVNIETVEPMTETVGEDKLVDGRLLVALAPLALKLGQHKGDIGIRLVTMDANYSVTWFNRGWCHKELDGGCDGCHTPLMESDAIAIKLSFDRENRTMRLSELMALTKE